MLGKLLPARVMAGVVLMLGCAHDVAQDSATGPDGKIKGARPMALDNGEAKAAGVVTYPGGDRIDWKQVEVPARGTLDIKLTWMPPRPGLQLAFDVFDEFNAQIAASKKASKKQTRGRTKTAKLDVVKGTYFIRVYAVGRGDAGKYKLTVDFAPSFDLDLTKVEIAEPPKLAAVPEAEVPCDEFSFDAKNPACKAVCPAQNAPPGWPGCAGKCPNPPDANIAACAATMPCPAVPDPRIKACNKPAQPVVSRVLKNEVQGGELIITIGAGSSGGVAKGWRAVVLRGDSDAALPGGEIAVIRVDKAVTIGKVRLTTDQIRANDRVKLSPP